jgi:hypothetical protein
VRRHPPLPPGALAVPFPLRPDFLAEVVVPKDMTALEARRLCAMLLTLAHDAARGREGGEP